MATAPVRVDQELFAAAKAAGELHSRSAAQQLSHWARIGRALEAAPSVSHGDISRVLAGEMSYDDLGDDTAQAIVREEWRAQMAERLASLNFEDELRATGQPWVVGDEDGNVVVRGEAADAAA